MAEWKSSSFYILVRIQSAIAAIRGYRSPSGPDAGSTLGFRDPTRLTRWTGGFLYAHLVIAVVRFCIWGLETSLGSFELWPPAGITWVALQLLAVYGTWVLVPVWTHLANRNVRQLGASGLTFTPGWAAAWYFLPPGLFWKPYQVMKEIWQASVDPADWSGQRGSPLVGWWWALWLVVTWGESLVYGVATLLLEPADAQSVENASRLVSRLLQVPLTLLLLTIITRVRSLQMRHYHADPQ